MRLALSTETAPDLSLDALVEACGRRGLAALELVDGHAHGVSTSVHPEALAPLRRGVTAAGGRIAAFRFLAVQPAVSPLAAALAAGLGAPVIAPVARDGADEEDLLRAAGLYAAAGGTLLLAHGSNPVHVERLQRVVQTAPAGALGLAWDVDPADDALAASAAAVLKAAGPHLRHVQLRGGGPEAAGQEGRGIGPLMARLTLAGYDRTIALAPSTPRFRYAWAAWLGRHGGWGCGSKSADDSLVRLDVDN